VAREPVIKVEGAKELRASLKRAGADMKDFTAAHREAAAVVAAAAGPDTPRVTGMLASSIRPGATQTQAIVRAGGARVPYAGPIHWGWPRRNITPALFLTQPAAQTEPTWTEIYLQRLEDIIDKVHGA
jgi:hypothetical protein